MPPYRHSQRGWLTGDSLAPETGRVLIIPGDLAFLMAVNGALTELQYEWNWEQFGTVTPEEAADAMRIMLADYFVSGFVPPMELGLMSSVDLWHRFSVVTTGGALVTSAPESTQPFNYVCTQSPAANGDDFYQYAWLAAGNYEIKVLGVRIANQGQFRVIMQYQADMSTVTALPTTDFHGATLFNFVVSSTFTLTKSGLYKVFGQVPGKNAASSGYTVRLTMMKIVRTS